MELEVQRRLLALMVGVTFTRQNGALREPAEADPERILDVPGPAAETLAVEN